MRKMKLMYKIEDGKPESERSRKKSGIDAEIILKGILKIAC